jgi:hypothetical protein
MKSKSLKSYICGILAISAAIVILVMDTAEQNCTIIKSHITSAVFSRG